VSPAVVMSVDMSGVVGMAGGSLLKGCLGWGTEYAAVGQGVPTLRKPVPEVGRNRARWA
jgi:hypothetical protein